MDPAGMDSSDTSFTVLSPGPQAAAHKAAATEISSAGMRECISIPIVSGLFSFFHKSKDTQNRPGGQVSQAFVVRFPEQEAFDRKTARSHRENEQVKAQV